jgi:hypothetical protein
VHSMLILFRGGASLAIVLLSALEPQYGVATNAWTRSIMPTPLLGVVSPNACAEQVRHEARKVTCAEHQSLKSHTGFCSVSW